MCLLEKEINKTFIRKKPCFKVMKHKLALDAGPAITKIKIKFA